LTRNINLLLFILFILTFHSCNSDFTPKPRGYFKIDFPKRGYQSYDQPGYPYSFEYPVYAKITKDSSLFDENPDNPYWVNIEFPSFNSKIYLSYKTIGGTTTFKVKQESGYKDSTAVNTFERLREDAFKMTFKHSYKATSIEDSAFVTPNGVGGIYFYVGGNAATSRQFYVTDTTRHFLRGALYFDATPNEDSLGIVRDFIQEDMKHLINTIRWKDR
jgi:gliding motility-associated lipoprotein GldD